MNPSTPANPPPGHAESLRGISRRNNVKGMHELRVRVIGPPYNKQSGDWTQLPSQHVTTTHDSAPSDSPPCQRDVVNDRAELPHFKSNRERDQLKKGSCTHARTHARPHSASPLSLPPLHRVSFGCFFRRTRHLPADRLLRPLWSH